MPCKDTRQHFSESKTWSSIDSIGQGGHEKKTLNNEGSRVYEMENRKRHEEQRTISNGREFTREGASLVNILIDDLTGILLKSKTFVNHHDTKRIHNTIYATLKYTKIKSYIDYIEY